MVRRDYNNPDHLMFTFPGINRFNFMVVHEVKEELEKIHVQKKMKITLDMNEIHFVDSAGFDFLVKMVQEAEICDFEFEMIHVLPDVTELIKLLQLEDILGKYEYTT